MRTRSHPVVSRYAPPEAWPETSAGPTRRRWRTVVVDVLIVGALVAWGVTAWVTHGTPGTATSAPKARAHTHTISSSDPFGAFNPVGPHGVLDCDSYLGPLLRSLRAVQHSVDRHAGRPDYEAQLSIEQGAYSRSNFGALDERCAALVATPAAAASDLYARADSVWSGCDPGHCVGPGPSTLLRGLWSRANRDVARAIQGRDALERPWVSLHRAR
jgi:hypothetical protein